mgnify:CR=1 FL=1|tara:strand:+ start:2031 stop:2450 length:420 start_codon:yes stop_codon:yes gene_type:complete
MDKSKIIRLIKIKGPLLMIDRIKRFKLNKNILTEYRVKKNSWFYKYHLLDKPIMPGILMEESMFQSGVSLLYLEKKYSSSSFLLLESKTKFYGEIKGDHKLSINTILDKKRKNMFYFHSTILSKNIIISKSQFTIFNKN